MRSLTFLAALLIAFAARTTAAQEAPTPTATTELYVRSFGDPSRPAIVFLHGGPGYNCASFEITAAPILARDFRVVVYDQRGCGRSPTGTADCYTFERSLADLSAVITSQGLRRPHFIGHSFGGAIALKFAETHPDALGTVVLVGAPVSYTTLDLAPLLHAQKARVRAIYGAEDWTLDADTRALLAGELGEAGFATVEGASHSVFVDQPTRFCKLVVEKLAPAPPRKD